MTPHFNTSFRAHDPTQSHRKPCFKLHRQAHGRAANAPVPRPPRAAPRFGGGCSVSITSLCQETHAASFLASTVTKSLGELWPQVPRSTREQACLPARAQQAQGQVPLLLLLDSGILSCISFQTLEDRTALLKNPHQEPAGAQAQFQGQAPEPDTRQLLQTPSPECRHLWQPDALGQPSCVEEVTETSPALNSRGCCLQLRHSQYWAAGTAYLKYTNIHNPGLRYWMTWYTLLKRFSAQSVA